MEQAAVSSTSSSKRSARNDAGGRRALRSDGVCVVVFLATFLVLAGAGAVYMRQPGSELKPIIAQAERPKGGEWYLSYQRASVSEYVLYHNLNHAIDAVKDADVLFLGNSRVMFAFGQEELKPFFAKLGLSYYVLAFPYGEPSRFFQAIIRKHDLRPKWVVVNADPFFVNRTSRFAEMVMAENWWDAWKFKLEMDLGFLMRSRLHQIVPCYDMTRPQKADWITFGSYHDGATHVAVARGNAGEFKKFPAGKEAVVKPQLLTVAKRFKEEMDRRGARMVLTTLPPQSPKLATALGAALDVPVVLPHVKHLTTYDGGHMDRGSAARYANAFLAELEKVIAQGALAQQ